MKNKYEIIDDGFGIQVSGECFCHEDLYELIGKNRFMSTFEFRHGTEARSKYGESVTGVIFYSKDEADILKNLNQDEAKTSQGLLKIHSPMPNLTQAQREDLKYGGVAVADIHHISFLPYTRDEGRYQTGEKVVPNVIEIPCEDNSRVDYDNLYRHYIASKINSKTELIPYEKEKFIGIMLGINNGHVDSRLLNLLGFEPEDARNNLNICYHRYKTRERRGTISEEEKAKLADLEFIRWSNTMIKFLGEIKKSGVSSKGLLGNEPVIRTILSSLSRFEPDILLYGKKQVYWDIDSYLHITMRHVKQLQLGHFKDRTPFPYRFEDLETLIHQVLGTIEHEIERHFSEKPGKNFLRLGKMSVFFNGDYYCLQINKEGRLVTLYVNG
jgi:hypothetical protein